MKELNEFRLKIARIHEQMLATPRRWASYGDVAEAIGRPGGGIAVGQACIKVLWENGYSTQLFARADGSNGWTAEDLSHVNADLVCVLDNMLRVARNIPLLPYEQNNRVSLDELMAMATKQDVPIRDDINLTPTLEEIDDPLEFRYRPARPFPARTGCAPGGGRLVRRSASRWRYSRPISRVAAHPKRGCSRGSKASVSSSDLVM